MHTQLSFLQLVAIGGLLMLGMALSSAHLRRLPISTAAVYLFLGLLLGPLGANWLRLNLQNQLPWLERITELALIISLFVGGLKLRQPIRSPAWRASYRLAGPLMLCSIAAVALLAHYVLSLPPPLALLLGAILAPTDPVLASAVSVSKAADRDHLRYGLSGEAGLNDGLAYPFVMFGILWFRGELTWQTLGDWTLATLWAIPAGLMIGFVLGHGVGQLAVWLRSHHRDTHAPSDFLALALIALSYTAAQFLGALGFLSAFAAGVGLRRAEMKIVHNSPHPSTREQSDAKVTHPPAEDLVQARVTEEAIREPAIAAGVLVAETISFGDTAERLLEVALVVLVGVSVATYWHSGAVVLALLLFIGVRPLCAHLVLLGTPTSRTQRWLLGWFGVRGIGSLYYMSYALNHGIRGDAAVLLAQMTLSVVAMSILIHGITAQPLLGYYEHLRRHVRQRRAGQELVDVSQRARHRQTQE